MIDKKCKTCGGPPAYHDTVCSVCGDDMSGRDFYSVESTYRDHHGDEWGDWQPFKSKAAAADCFAHELKGSETLWVRMTKNDNGDELDFGWGPASTPEDRDE